jgi:hypothetical protein
MDVAAEQPHVVRIFERMVLVTDPDSDRATSQSEHQKLTHADAEVFFRGAIHPQHSANDCKDGLAPKPGDSRIKDAPLHGQDPTIAIG